ncbi:MAG: hypothetical protein KGV46_02285 [Pasteurella sp.]|nr:hypothetical protein [Pasteurella sp.]
MRKNLEEVKVKSSTEDSYSRIAMMLFRSANIFISDLENTPADADYLGSVERRFYNHFYERIEKVKKSTFYLYKNAVLWYLDGRCELLCQMISDFEFNGLANNQRVRGSSNRQKFINDDQLDKLMIHLANGRDTAIATLGFLYTTMYFGVRPMETAEMRFIEVEKLEDGYKGICEVRNAKFDDMRSFGEKRRIHFNLDENTLDIIIFFVMYKEDLQKIHGVKKGYEKCYHRCKNCLYNACKKLFKGKRKISLYSGRHQFIANLKSAGYKENEICALVGHRSPESAKIHYGKKFKGSYRGRGDDLRAMIKPDKECLALVNEFHSRITKENPVTVKAVLELEMW